MRALAGPERHDIYKSLGRDELPPFPPPLPSTNTLIPLLPLLQVQVECYQTLLQSLDISLKRVCLLIPRQL